MNTSKEALMFSVMELRVIRNSVHLNMQKKQEKLKILDSDSDSDSDDGVETTNDLMLYQNILDKINDREDI